MVKTGGSCKRWRGAVGDYIHYEDEAFNDKKRKKTMEGESYKSRWGIEKKNKRILFYTIDGIRVDLII